MAIKSSATQSFLARPDPKLRAVLVHGQDAGMVSERAQGLAALLAAREQPPGEILRIDDADLEGDPERLAVELLTVPMFGGAKIVRATAGRRINAGLLQPLVEGGGLTGALIVEAGALRRDDKLRTLFEKSPHAAAVACFLEEAHSLDSLVSEVLGAAGMSISPEARQELLARIGADRVLSRGEIEKLVVYAHGAARIELADVEAIVGDASDLAVDHVVTAAAAGDLAKALAECDRVVSSGDGGQAVILAAERHFHRLHRLRAAVDAGRSADELVRGLRPPPPPKVQNALLQQARLWTTERASRCLARIVEAVRQARTTGTDDAIAAERLLIEIAQLARAGAREAQAGGPGRGRPARAPG